MKDQIIQPLVVYSASAGSGKTFSLVQNYLQLTLRDEAGPMNFAKIIAMTFTNKAAWEMKDRIIQALFLLSNAENTDKKVMSLLAKTQENTQLSKDKIHERSKRVLGEILHQYENFNVLTIDKFSLRLIRTFSRDLDLQENFEVTLDEKILLEQVIDELLSKIGKPGEEEITQLTLNYAKSNLSEGDSWNFRRDLIEFSKILTKETDQNYVQALIKKEFNQDNYKEIGEELNRLSAQHLKNCHKIYQYFISLNTNVDDYPGKSKGIYKVLESLPSRILVETKPPSKTVQDTLDGTNVKGIHKVDEKLIKMMSDLYQLEKQLNDRVYVLKSLRSSFYNLALLKYISKELSAFKEKENLIGIFEFGQKIAELLKKENAPYIYERLGNRYNHYLLDEFQDTSRLQWINLIPLLHESISHNYSNLIVGDPKQAIYRFRNGLVEQFVVLPEIYNPENDKELAQVSAYFSQMGRKEALGMNFRSKKNIVEFNNLFFTRLLEFMPPDFSKYYEDIRQESNSKSGGFVSIDLLDKGISKEETEELQVEFLLGNIKKCIADGYDPGDICILTRNKKEGNRFARYLVENNYKVVSSNSLVISSDLLVIFCIDYLNLRINTSNKTNQIKLATSFYRLQKKDPIVALSSFWKDNKVGDFDFNTFIQNEFDNSENLFFPYENLYDLGTKLFALVGISELRNSYLQHLLELFQNYDLNFGPDIRGFMDEWNAKLKDSSVQIPENKEAVKIMTIHKSKGLEFPVVIIPALSWKINPAKNDQFVKTEDGELLYSKLKRDAVPHYIFEQYKYEYEQLLLDELNVLYVAFTRPSERLYILTETKLPSASSGFYNQLNYPIVQSLEVWDDELTTERTANYIKIGEESKKVQTDAEINTESNSFIPKNLNDFLWFPELALQDEEALETEDLNEERQFGNQLHLVLSKLDEGNNIDEIVEKLILKGKVEVKWRDEIATTATKVTELLEQQTFVQTAKETLNEQAILISESEIKRPDKIYISNNKAIVIDFKTGTPSRHYQNQVRDYCKQLYDVGFEETEGYLLYTQNMSLEKVK